MPCCKILLDNLEFLHSRKFPASYGNELFVVLFLRFCYLSIFSVRLFQFTLPNTLSVILILTLTSIYNYVYQVVCFVQVSWTKFYIQFCSLLYLPHPPLANELQCVNILHAEWFLFTPLRPRDNSIHSIKLKITHTQQRWWENLLLDA
jgi:hypothetical protein